MKVLRRQAFSMLPHVLISIVCSNAPRQKTFFRPCACTPPLLDSIKHNHTIKLFEENGVSSTRLFRIMPLGICFEKIYSYLFRPLAKPKYAYGTD